jgi:peptidoglycan/xylan/chitin deacetylase (PgdA/CDA1 family)
MAAAGMLRGRWYDGPCRVITYHGVRPAAYPRQEELDGALVEAEEFRRQLGWLKTNYELVSPQAFRAALRGGTTLPARAALLTCDDGHLNNLTVMLPWLREAGLSCMFFVTSGGREDTPRLLSYEAARLTASEREEMLADPVQGQRLRLMNVAQLKQLAAAGMGIGSHTVSHPALAKLSSEVARREISESKAALEAMLGQSVWALAYPFGGPGSVSEREWEMARDAGYECAFMNVDGPWPDHPYALPRVHITAAMKLAEFQAQVSGLHECVRRTAGRRKA